MSKKHGHSSLEHIHSVSYSWSTLWINEIAIDPSHSHRGRNTLDAAASHVTNRENSQQSGFEEIRLASKGPASSAQIFWRQIGTRLYETFSVERDATIEPTGVRSGAGHNECMTDLLLLRLLCLTVSPLFFQRITPQITMNVAWSTSTKTPNRKMGYST